MNDLLKKLGELKLIPVVAIHDADHADALAEALIAGGLPCAEVTFRTAAAPEAIAAMARHPQMLVGAGTVLSVEQAKAAVDRGAKFLVSPGTNPPVVKWAVENNVPITPGVATPSEIDLAMSFGLDVLKFFPANIYGGPEALKAIGAPYSMIKFIPTGGVSAENLREYLKLKNVLACGGSWMVKSELISGGQFKKIAELTAQAVSLASAGG